MYSSRNFLCNVCHLLIGRFLFALPYDPQDYEYTRNFTNALAVKDTEAVQKLCYCFEYTYNNR
jgi:hypothetical protein